MLGSFDYPKGDGNPRDASGTLEHSDGGENMNKIILENETLATV